VGCGCGSGRKAAGYVLRTTRCATAAPGAPGAWRVPLLVDRGRHCFTFHIYSIQALPTALFNGQTPLGVRCVQYGCYETTYNIQLRGLPKPKHENWPVCDPRANGATDGPYCSPTWPSVFGRRCEPLAGRGGGFGGRSCTSAHTRRVGRFFNSSGLD
jgi:hypothetical protein